MRPAPAWPERCTEPATLVYDVHRRPRLGARASRTHRLPASRPAAARSNVSLTGAASERAKEMVVPETPRRATVALRVPRWKRRRLSFSPLTSGVPILLVAVVPAARVPNDTGWAVVNPGSPPAT